MTRGSSPSHSTATSRRRRLRTRPRSKACACGARTRTSSSLDASATATSSSCARRALSRTRPLRELDLLEQYLVRLRQELLMESHAILTGDWNDTGLRHARGVALQAELVERIRASVKELAKDPGEFIKRNLQ